MSRKITIIMKWITQRGALRPLFRFVDFIWGEILLSRQLRQAGLSISKDRTRIDFTVGAKTVRLHKRHAIYSGDIINGFNYYFDSVESFLEDGQQIVDFSTPKFHTVKGFELIPVHFPSLAEPINTTLQYINFANLRPGDTVLDLGAYSGLTSILFKEIVGKQGRVVAVEADLENLTSLEKNHALYKKVSRMDIEVIQQAIWNHSEGVSFSTEGSMGSSASSIVGLGRGDIKLIDSITLSDVVKRLKLTDVTFVKCDIEGAESVIFEDGDFFAEFSPRIIVETHTVGGNLTTEKVKRDLEKFGYSFNLVPQPGSPFPLLECAPTSR
jgi:FkbM family methyltransferase